MKPLQDAHVRAVRAARPVDPGSIIDSTRLDHKRRVIHPLAGRIPKPPRLRILGEVPSICPDHPPDSAVGVQHENLLRKLNNLSHSKLIKVFARHPLRIAQNDGVVRLAWQNASERGGGFGSLQHLQSKRSERRLMRRIAVVWPGGRTLHLNSAGGARIPSSADVMAGSRSGLLRLLGQTRNRSMPTIQDRRGRDGHTQWWNVVGGRGRRDLRVQKRRSQKRDDDGPAGVAAYSHGGGSSFAQCDSALPYCFGDASVFGCSSTKIFLAFSLWPLACTTSTTSPMGRSFFAGVALTVIWSPSLKESPPQPRLDMLSGFCVSKIQWTTWPASSVASTKSRQWGLLHTHLLTVPFIVTVLLTS